MPKNKVKQKRHRKKPLKLDFMLEKFDEMENTLEHSLLGMRSDDDESCSSSTDSYRQTRNSSDLGESSKNSREMEETENIEKLNTKAGTSGVLNSKLTSSSKNITNETPLNDFHEIGKTSQEDDIGLKEKGELSNLVDSKLTSNSKNIDVETVGLSQIPKTKIENISQKNNVQKFEDKVGTSRKPTSKSKSSNVENVLNDSLFSDDSDSSYDSENIDLTDFANDDGAGKNPECGTDSEKILSNAESVNFLDTSSVTSAMKFSSHKNSVVLEDSFHHKDAESIKSENIISEANDPDSNETQEYGSSEIISTKITSDNVPSISKNSDPAEIDNFGSNVPTQDSHENENSKAANSENIVFDSVTNKDPEFVSSQVLGSKDLDVSKNSDYAENFSPSILSNDNFIHTNSESVFSESDSIISADSSRFSKNSESLNSENTSLKKNKKRKRGSCALKEISDESSGFISEPSLYLTPAANTTENSFYDVKFYSNLSEIFETPLSSKSSKSFEFHSSSHNSKHSKSFETPLTSRNSPSKVFKTSSPSSYLPGDSSPNLSRSLSYYAPLSGDFNLCSSSEPILRDQSNRSKNSSRSSSHIASLLKEQNYSITPFPLSSNSDIEDCKETENFSNHISSVDFLDQSFNKENKVTSKKRGKKNALKRDCRKSHNLRDFASKSSGFLFDNDYIAKDSEFSLDKFSSRDLFLCASKNEPSLTESNILARDEPDFKPITATTSLPFTPCRYKESGFLRSVEFQQNSEMEVLSPAAAPKKDQSQIDRSLMMTTKFNDLKDRLDFGTSTPKTDNLNHSGSTNQTFNVPVAASSLSLHQIAVEACRRIGLSCLSSPPRWPIYFPLTEFWGLFSRIVKGFWNLRVKVSRHSEIDWKGQKPRVSTAQSVVSTSPAKLNSCCSCQCLATVMPKLISKIETLDSDIQQIKSLLVQKAHMVPTFGGPPAPPPPPPPPPPSFLLTPVPIKTKSEKSKQDSKKKDEMTRPPITVEDLRRVTLRKTPLPQNKERKVSTDPRGPVVSLEMLRSVKLRPRRRIIDSGGSYSIKSFLSKSSRERSDIIDRILNSSDDTTNDLKTNLVDSDMEENPSKKSRTETHDEKEQSSQQS